MSPNLNDPSQFNDTTANIGNPMVPSPSHFQFPSYGSFAPPSEPGNAEQPGQCPRQSHGAPEEHVTGLCGACSSSSLGTSESYPGEQQPRSSSFSSSTTFGDLSPFRNQSTATTPRNAEAGNSSTASPLSTRPQRGSVVPGSFIARPDESAWGSDPMDYDPTKYSRLPAPEEESFREWYELRAGGDDVIASRLLSPPAFSAAPGNSTCYAGEVELEGMPMPMPPQGSGCEQLSMSQEGPNLHAAGVIPNFDRSFYGCEACHGGNCPGWELDEWLQLPGPGAAAAGQAVDEWVQLPGPGAAVAGQAELWDTVPPWENEASAGVGGGDREWFPISSAASSQQLLPEDEGYVSL